MSFSSRYQSNVLNQNKNNQEDYKILSQRNSQTHELTMLKQ